MKKIIILITLSINLNAQLDTIKIIPTNIDSVRHFKLNKIGKYYQVILRGEDYFSNYIALDEFNCLEIKGDTIKLIETLLRRIKETSNEKWKIYEENLELIKTIEVGVKFLNHIPEHYRTKEGNCIWEKYFNRLKKLGYKATKQNKSLDCK